MSVFPINPDHEEGPWKKTLELFLCFSQSSSENVEILVETPCLNGLTLWILPWTVFTCSDISSFFFPVSCSPSMVPLGYRAYKILNFYILPDIWICNGCTWNLSMALLSLNIGIEPYRLCLGAISSHHL